MDASPFPVYLCMGEDLLVTIANESTLKAWGKTEDVIGKPFHEVLPELEGQPFRQLLLDVYHTGIGHSFTDKRADIIVEGILQTFYFTFSYQPFRDDDGTLKGVFCIANDVTELVLAKAKLAASEESARLAIAAAHLGSFDNNLLSGEMFWDARCRELFDIRDQHRISYNGDFLPGLHPDDRERIDDHIRKFSFINKISDGDYNVEYRAIGAGDGKTRWVRSKGKVFFDQKNNPVRFIGIVIDITDVKQADEQAALLTAIINYSYDAIISMNLDGIVESWNEAADRIFGFSSEEMIGQSIYKIIPQRGHQEEQHILSRLKKGEQVEHYETKRQTKDLKQLDVSSTISPILDKQGNIVGLSKIARDITDQKNGRKTKKRFYYYSQS
nr:PAS domain S-box protein [Pedobacter sp. L105]